MFKSLTFDGENSLDYGVHINGEGVYNAPERDVEMIAIPGRNGEYALDHGRFNNIEVAYPAGIGEMSQADFADKISAFRNALASRKGYCRLEDGYHPDEFRMGVYKSGLEASPVVYNRAGQFDLVFNCKPQRFLKSGEQATEFTQDGTITNPTLFESKPLLELYGYGTLNVNGSEITLHNDPLGVITLLDQIKGTAPSFSVSFNSALVNNGDTITVALPQISFRAKPTSGYKARFASSTAGTCTNGTILDESTSIAEGLSMRATLDTLSFVKGTSKTVTYTRQLVCGVYPTGNPSQEVTGKWKATCKIIYNGTNKFTVTFTNTISVQNLGESDCNAFIGPVYGDSSVLPLGSPLYLDCEIGEAYKETGGEITLINKNVDIPSDLPVLSPGANTITLDNTFTKVNIIPRWWII